MEVTEEENSDYTPDSGITEEQRANSRPLTLATHRKSNLVVFYDTGAPGNLVSLQTYTTLFNHLPLNSENVDQYMCDINGNKLDCVGCINLTLMIASATFDIEVNVIRGINIPGHLLIGYPAMVRNHMLIDTVRDGVVIGDYIQPFYRAEDHNVHIVIDEPKNPQIGDRKVSVYIKPRKKSLKCVTDARKKETDRHIPLFSVETRKVCSISNSEVKDRLSKNLQKPISVKRDICVKSGQNVITVCNIKHKSESMP